MTVKFIVDTDSYSGDFEREMCSFMTGARDGTNVGQKDADSFLEIYETPLPVIYVQSNHGMSPVKIVPTPGFLNNGYGFHYKENEEEKLALEKYKEEIILDAKRSIEQLYALRKTEGADKLNINFSERIADLEKEINETNQLVEFKPYPAYMSIKIEFEDLPSHLFFFLKERAEIFAQQNEINIIGFRIEGEKE